MIPIRIKLHGFMPFRDEVELNFDTANLWMLCGRNGAGKSTIFDAITFVLFGEGRFGGGDVKAYMNQEVVRGNASLGAGRTLSVQFDFDIGPQRYRVRRLCKLIGKEGKEQPVSEWSAHKLNDQGMESPPIVGTDKKSGYLDWILRTLGLNYEAFASSALLKQGESERLITSTNSVRDEILRRIINLSDYEKLQATVKAVSAKWVTLQNQAETQMTALKGQMVNTANAAVQAFELPTKAFASTSPSGPKDYWLDPEDLEKVAELIALLQTIETNASTEEDRLQIHLDSLRYIQGRLENWKSNHKAKAHLLFKRAAYDDVLYRAPEIERNYARSQELCKALPLLDKWKTTRKDWKDAEERRTKAIAEIDRLENYHAKLQKQRPDLITARDNAQTHLSNTTTAVGSATAVKEALSKRKQELEQSQGQPLCHVCGKELSEVQRQRLLEQVTEDLKQEEANLLQLKKSEEEAKTALKATGVDLTKHDAAIKKAELDIKDQEKNRDGAIKDRANAETVAQGVITTLYTVQSECAQFPVGSASYQSEDWRACLLISLEVSGALQSGIYPNEADVLSVKQERDGLKHASEEKQALDEARQKAGQLKAQIAVHDSSIADAVKEIGIKADGLEDRGQPITDALREAEQAIQEEETERNNSLAERIDQASMSPLKITTECIRQSKANQEAAKARALNARDARLRLFEKHSGYLPLIPEWKKASHYARLYITLTTKLGREGVQSWLRKEAERRIVEYADLTLQRLTNSMLNVRLAENSDETLDLQVTDHEKNARDLKPGALSGSQKFRLSVSLALGIGQYACAKNEGGIQSVIIDEGFGSLDKEGRDQMTAELENLGKILKRIIVVSHQEDMETAFDNRWRIYVEDGTSKAELMP